MWVSTKFGIIIHKAIKPNRYCTERYTTNPGSALRADVTLEKEELPESSETLIAAQEQTPGNQSQINKSRGLTTPDKTPVQPSAGNIYRNICTLYGLDRVKNIRAKSLWDFQIQTRRKVDREIKKAL